VETVRSVCILGDFKIGEVRAQDLISPIATHLYRCSEWQKLEPIMQYYMKVLKDGGTQTPEAIQLFQMMLNVPDKKSADDAAAVLTKYANATVDAIISGKHERREDYENVALMLKDAKRQMNLDISAWENAPVNARSSDAFYRLEKFNREKIANLNPPGASQLDNIATGLQYLGENERRAAFANLLGLYWQSEAMRDETQLRKYIQYLYENGKLKLYVQNNIGTEQVRVIFAAEIDRAMARDFISEDEKIEEIIRWLNTLRQDCGFHDEDPIFGHLVGKLNLLGGIDAFCKSLSPKAIKLLAGTFKSLDAGEISQTLLAITSLDEAAGSKGEFSRVRQSWSAEPRYFLLRMEYWFSKTPEIPTEWALSRAAFEAEYSSRFGSEVAENFLNYRGVTRSAKDDLINLYEAMYIVEDNKYSLNLADELFAALKARVFQIINDIEDRNDFASLFASAAKFRTYSGRIYSSTRMPAVGREIAARLKHTCPDPPPFEVLKKFNAAERELLSYSGGSSVVADILALCLVASLLAATASAIALLFSENGLVATVFAVLPGPYVFAFSFSGLMFLSFLLILLQVLRPE
jgi:hypothetical protein